MKRLVLFGAVVLGLASVTSVAEADPPKFGPKFNRPAIRMAGNDFGAKAFNATMRNIHRNPAARRIQHQALGQSMNSFGQGMGNWANTFAQSMARFARAKAAGHLKQFGL